MLLSTLILLALGIPAPADDAIRGSYAGEWSGASGAGGKFKLSVAQDGDKTKCTVNFTYAGEDVPTHVTLCKTEGRKLEAQYDFDFSGNRLQSTIEGELKGNALAGTYHTKSLADGSAVDQGDWKAAPAQ